MDDETRSISSQKHAVLWLKACETAGTTPAIEKGLTSAVLRFYASKDCHLLLQVRDDSDVDAIMNSANAERTAMSPGGHFSG
jgi:hypothetical protein